MAKSKKEFRLLKKERRKNQEELAMSKLIEWAEAQKRGKTACHIYAASIEGAAGTDHASEPSIEQLEKRLNGVGLQTRSTSAVAETPASSRSSSSEVSSWLEKKHTDRREKESSHGLSLGVETLHWPIAAKAALTLLPVSQAFVAVRTHTSSQMRIYMGTCCFALYMRNREQIFEAWSMICVDSKPE